MSIEGNRGGEPQVSWTQVVVGAGIMFSGLFVMNKPERAAALDENVAELAELLGGTGNLSYVGIAIALVGIALLATSTKRSG